MTSWKCVECFSIRQFCSDVLGPFLRIYVPTGHALCSAQPRSDIEVPDFDRVVRARAGQCQTVRTPCETFDSVGMIIQRLNELACSRIAKIYFLIAAARGEHAGIAPP